jgi:hypothetical protein
MVLKQKRELEKAVRAGNLNLAREILGKKPSIDVLGSKRKRKH